MGVRGARQLALNESAAIAPLYAIGIFTLVGIAGVGFDYTRMMSLHSELQNAADQAALAGASQLDGKAGTCSRAATAARTFILNNTRFAKDGSSPAVTFQDEPGCDGTGRIRFWQDREGTTAATADANARYIEVFVDPRSTTFSLTPLIDLFSSGEMRAAAMAGLGASICKQPPIMICHPNPGTPFNADGRIGQGVVATGHSTGKGQAGGNASDGDVSGPTTGNTNMWAPGDFGFLQIPEPAVVPGDKKLARNARLLRALAYDDPPTDCISLEDNRVNTGNPQGLYDAINTRFGIYDFQSNENGGNVLAPCEGGACTAAPNVRSDVIPPVANGNGGGNGNGNGGGGGSSLNCQFKNNGFEFPADSAMFKPVGTGYNADTRYSEVWPLTRMGLPRDLCHYTSFGSGTGKCGTGTGRFGDGKWAREDYWQKNHSGVTRPTDWRTMTRYQTYLWENANARGQAPVCGKVGDAQRRVLTVAVVSNCADLTGTAKPVVIDEFVDMFLVEPSSDKRPYNQFKDAVYMEIIGKSTIAGNGVFGSQQVRRDVPYIVR